MKSALHGHETVAVIVSKNCRPLIHGIADPIGTQLQLDGDLFLDSGKGDWLGFYDWLRPTSGEIIGVRIWLDEELPQLLSLTKCQGVEFLAADRQLLIFFGEEKSFDESYSCDQDFGSNQLMISNSRFLLAFRARYC